MVAVCIDIYRYIYIYIFFFWSSILGWRKEEGQGGRWEDRGPRWETQQEDAVMEGDEPAVDREEQDGAGRLTTG